MDSVKSVSTAASAVPELHLYRDGRRTASSAELIAELKSELRRLPVHLHVSDLLSPLLRAGELECALQDGGFPQGHRAAKLTDLLAEAVVHCDASQHPQHGQLLGRAGLQIVDAVSTSGTLTIATPEGFAYYELHPLDYADLVARLQLDTPSGFVVGIRSIGTTLSAMAAAKLRSLGIPADRTTVRPTGHPYDRRCAFNAAQRQMIARANSDNTAYLICDEGPGRSGSTFLSVAEALEREGVARERIVLLCSRELDAATLCAPDAPRRWKRYWTITSRASAESTRQRRADGSEPPAVALSGKDRNKGSAECHSWDGFHLHKFEGFGPYGQRVRARRQALLDAGFVLPAGAPWSSMAQTWRVGRQEDLSPQLLKRMAGYCAWRAREFRTTGADAGELEMMASMNFERAFGRSPRRLVLPVERPTVCDAYMTPQQWFHRGDGRWFKLDAATHGENHFFPGPCDVAWDLAGIVVEWNLEGSAQELLLNEYRRASGDNPSSRIGAYEFAYRMFRLACQQWSLHPIPAANKNAAS